MTNGKKALNQMAEPKSAASTIAQLYSEDPDNDFWLIYAYDDFKDAYLLLTIIG